MARGLVLVAVLLAALGGASARSGVVRPPAPGGDVELVVTLAQPPLAAAYLRERTLFGSGATRRLSLRAPASVSYLRELASAQRSVQAHVARAIPGAVVRWHYSVVANGFAVVVPRAQAARLASVPGVAAVWPSVRYHALLDRTPGVIGAPTLWGPSFATSGQTIKIGIVDDGLDQSHPFFDPKGFAYPAGFPKGQKAFTTPKVIAARAFPPAHSTWKYATSPFDPKESEHATHVAGIAAGDRNTPAVGTRVSGVAPSAYLGNYKVLTVPTQSFGLDGNSPEIAAGIEAAVRDGMNVINLSLGEPEIEPSRDLVVQALARAWDAGVVPVVAAGNDYGAYGRGSIGSPGSADKTISVAASTTPDAADSETIASFSSSGPTPISLLLKPDVSAPGSQVLSSVPRHNGLWARFDGTSMASPHVAGAAALLLERHPAWTPAQVRSALVTTADAVRIGGREAPTTREGGGRINLPRADRPLVFVAPTSLSFGLVRVGQSVSRTIAVSDAGGGAGPWTVSLQQQNRATAVTVDAPATVAAPGTVPVRVTAAADAPEVDLTGFVLLTRGSDVRRVPYWFRVTAPKLGSEPHGTLSRTGLYAGDTRGKPSLVSSYRYPEALPDLGIPSTLEGPEQVYRVTLARPVANFGVAIVSEGASASVQPRLVYAGDENRLVGYTGLPTNLNPYYAEFGAAELVVGAVRPATGVYDVVFDSVSASRAGTYRFRFWIGDTTPPTVRLTTRTVRNGGTLAVAVTDRGAGVDPRTLHASVDGSDRVVTLRGSRATVPVGALKAGRHRLVLTASDYQEAKNMENTGPILPNTRVLRTTFVVR